MPVLQRVAFAGAALRAALSPKFGKQVFQFGTPIGGGSSGIPDLSDLGVAILPHSLSPPERQTLAFLNLYKTSPWLHAVEAKVSDGVGGLEWELYLPGSKQAKRKALKHLGKAVSDRQRRSFIRSAAQHGDLVEVDDHPLLDLLDKPNALKSGFDLFKLTAAYLDFSGDAVWLIERNGAGMPITLWPIPPSWVISTPTAINWNFRIQFPAAAAFIPPSECVWFNDPDLAYPYGRGAGIARSLVDELEIDEFAAKMTKIRFYNGGKPELLIYGKGLAQLDDSQKKTIELDWRSKLQGYWNAYKPHFLRLADIQVQELSQKLVDLDISQLRRDQRDAIIHVWGFPPEVFGILESSNRSTIESADFIVQKHVILPRAKRIRSVLQSVFAPQFDPRLIIDFVSPVEEDRDYELKAMTTAPWSPTIEEWRERAGLPEDDGGGEHMVPFNLSAQALGGSSAAPVTPAAEPPKKEPSEPDAANTLIPAPTKVLAPHFSRSSRNGKKRAWRGTVVRGYSSEDLISMVQAIAAKSAPDVRAKLLSALGNASGSVDLKALDNALRGGRVHTALAGLPFDTLKSELEDAAKALAAPYGNAGTRSAEVVADQTGSEFAFDDSRSTVASWLKSHSSDLAAFMVANNLDGVRRTVEDFVRGDLVAPTDLAGELVAAQVGQSSVGADSLRALFDSMIADGKSREEILNGLAAAADEARTLRVARVAQSQALVAVNAGRQEAWEQAIRSGVLPVDIEKTWATSELDNVCFPDSAPVSTDRGEVPIGLLAVGDAVTSGDGKSARVVASLSRRFDGPLCLVRTRGGRAICCTPDHPVFTDHGWKKAREVNPGDSVNLLGDKADLVLCCVEVSHRQSDRLPSTGFEFGIPSLIACGVVKESSIDLNVDAMRGESEIKRPPSDWELLDEIKSHLFQAAPNGTLCVVLSSELPVAGEAAELPVVIAGKFSEDFAAVTAHYRNWRSPAPLGAVMPGIPLVSGEDLVASLALHFWSFILSLAFHGTEASASYFGKWNAELSTADLARDDSTRRRLRGIVASPGTELPGAMAVGLAGEEALSTSSAVIPERPPSGSVMVATHRAEDVKSLLPRAATELSIALLAAVGEGHPWIMSSVMSHVKRGWTAVRDVQLDRWNVFFVGGILVHNCPICFPMDGETIPATEMYVSSYNGRSYVGPGSPPFGPHDLCACGELLIF